MAGRTERRFGKAAIAGITQYGGLDAGGSKGTLAAAGG